MDTNELTTQLTALLNQYTAAQTARIQSLEDQLATAQAQIDTLHTTQAGRFTAHDPELRARLGQLANAPLDTIIRDAGVLFENRLRHLLGDSARDAHGVKLIDLAFNPGNGVYQVSDHTGEQQGLHMLYRGALQFIRNPPMHKLTEYDETTAAIHITLIDSLLSLLNQITKPAPSETPKKSTTWNIPRLRDAYATYDNRLLADRLIAVLDLAIANHAFAKSEAYGPTFGIKGATKYRTVNFSNDGGMYFYLHPGRYIDEDQRTNAFTVYQSLGLIEPHELLEEINDGRFSHRVLHDLGDDEWTYFQSLITALVASSLP